MLLWKAVLLSHKNFAHLHFLLVTIEYGVSMRIQTEKQIARTVVGIFLISIR